MKQLRTRCHLALMQALKDAREASGMSQRALAAKLRRANNFCTYVETGQRSISLCEVVEWMRLCGADPVELIKKIQG